MEQIELPPTLHVGQGYGKVSWAIRTLWESYVGWFRLQSSTELYPDSTGRALAELTEAAGTDAVLDRAEAALARGEAPLAIRLGEAVVAAEPDSARGVAVVCAAHRFLLRHGGDISFWENGWLRDQLARWEP
jgi:alkyl sulfatase BDS1-like metallo-beta-lactamase superfamily hydrolase